MLDKYRILHERAKKRSGFYFRIMLPMAVLTFLLNTLGVPSFITTATAIVSVLFTLATIASVSVEHYKFGLWSYELEHTDTKLIPKYTNKSYLRVVK